MSENLFNTIYNPDVLSCIANLSNDEVFTPPEVANAMLDMLPQTEQQSAFETLKRIVLAWDADFVKVTPAEAAALDAAEAETERGETVSDADIDWDAD